MVRRHPVHVMALASVLAIAACATMEPSPDKSPTDVKDSPAAECIPLSPLTLEAMSEQLTRRAAITSGEAVRLAEPEMDLRYIAALRIEDSTTQVGMLAMGGTEPGDVPWIAADDVAQLYLDWGAQDARPTKEAADRAASSEEGTAAKKCLR